MATIKELIEKAGQVAVLKAHPVGSYFITEEDRNPAEILGLGGVSTWVKLEGRVLLGASSAYPVGSEGGEATHKLSQSELPVTEGSLYMAVPAYHNNYATGIVSGSGRTGLRLDPAPATVANTTTQYGYKWKFGEGTSHNNLQPYRSAYIWRRTA